MTKNSIDMRLLSLLGALSVTILTVVAPVLAQSTVPGADRTQSANFNSNQPPSAGGSTSGGSGSNGGSKANYNGFSPTTGTWSNSGTPILNTTNGFNPRTGTWAGSASTATGGVWSSGTGAGGGSTNIFTPSQSVSGSNSAGNLNPSFGKLGNGPQVIPHVTVRSRLPIYSRVPIRPEL
jgi:hypothetical protein